jgi:hypothetical protein
MPGINFTQPIFNAAASAATDWGSVEGKVESEFTAGVTIKRGYDYEAGLSALVEVDAGFAKFLAAQVTGRASAEARVAAQVQLPLNLFDEAGAAVRVQAVAEAAAGIQAGLGLTMGDFIDLAAQVFGEQGVPIRLMILFLEEVDLTAGVYAKVSASAQAQAYATIVGTLLDDPVRGLKPGFNIVAGAGLGLAAGAGVRFFARAGFRSFPRFYAQAVDLVVDEIFDETETRLGSAAGPALIAALDAARPPFKIAFRLGYDVGDFLANQKPPQNAQGAAALAARVVTVVLEESQRYLLRNFIVVGLRQLRDLLAPRVAALDAAGRARIKPKRDTLIALLRARPEKLFDISAPQTQQFWIDAIKDIRDLVIDLFSGTNMPRDVRQALTVAWCASQLLIVATKRATRAEASVSVAGLSPQQAHKAFQGSPTAQPPDVVSDELAAGLGVSRPSAGWGLEHAVSYLTTTGAIAVLETAAPECKPYLDTFRGILGSTSAVIAKTVLENIGAVPDAGGTVDAQQTLRDLLGALQSLIDDVVDAQAMPAARTALAQSPEALLYLNEVLRPGLDFALSTCTDMLLNWSSGAVARTAATEALSGIILKLLGRTLVVTTDVVENYVQQQTQAVLETVATDVRSNGIATKFAALSHLPVDDAADRAADFLRLVGRTLAPFTETERSEMRSLRYTVLDPIPPAASQAFVDQLASDSFVPNAEAAGRLLQRTFDLLSERFVAFALGTLELFGSLFLNIIADALQAASDAIREWIAEAGRALAEAEQRLAELGLEILAATDAAAQFMNDALGELSTAFGAIGTNARREALKTRLADSFVDKANDLLEQNPIYRAIPSDLRHDARDSARAIVRGLAHDLAAPIFDAIAAVAEGVSDVLDDIRELNPSTGIATGVSEIILDHIEDGVRAAFGGDDPGITVGFDFTYSLPEIRLIPPGVVMHTHHVHVSLGRISLPISTFVGIVRDVITATSQFESAIDSAAIKLRSWLESELEAMAKKNERDGVAANSETLRADKAAVEGAPRDLWLASPANAGVYSDLVAVRIVLDDAAPEFVDFARGPQRFFAHLNGAELPADRFSVETRPALKDELKGVLGRAPFRPAAAAVVTGGIRSGAAASTARRTAAPVSAQDAPLSIAARRESPVWSTNAVTSARGFRQSPKSLSHAFDPGSRVRGIHLAGAVTTGPAGRPTRGGGPAIISTKPGTHLHDINISNVLDTMPRTTITLGTELGLNECVAGLNTLSITVVAADGSRLTRTATFIAEAPAKLVPPKRGERDRPVVLPPRATPVEPVRLKPRVAKTPLDAGARKTLSVAAKDAVMARKANPADRLVAASATLKDRLSAERPVKPADRSVHPKAQESL